MSSWKKVPASSCSRCGAPLGKIHVNTHRNEERFLGPGCDMVVRNDQILASYCLTCAEAAARDDLERLGFECHDIKNYAKTRFCTNCRTTRVDMNDWHPTYLIAVNTFDEENLGTLQEREVVVACPECEANHWKLRYERLEPKA